MVSKFNEIKNPSNKMIFDLEIFIKILESLIKPLNIIPKLLIL